MELKTFIKESLVQIVDAVTEAATYARGKGALINPRMAEERVRNAPPEMGFTSRPNPETVRNLGMFLTYDNRLADMVEFDVAVTASSIAEETGTTEGGLKAGVGIRVVSVEVGGKTESSSGRSEERRVGKERRGVGSTWERKR